jgi:hypothetical protein
MYDAGRSRGAEDTPVKVEIIWFATAVLANRERRGKSGEEKESRGGREVR